MPVDLHIQVERLMVSDEVAAEILGFKKTLLRQMDKTGELGPPSIVIRRRRLHNVEALRAWTRAGCPPRPEWLAQCRRTAKIDGGAT